MSTFVSVSLYTKQILHCLEVSDQFLLNLLDFSIFSKY